MRLASSRQRDRSHQGADVDPADSQVAPRKVSWFCLMADNLQACVPLLIGDGVLARASARRSSSRSSTSLDRCETTRVYRARTAATGKADAVAAALRPAARMVAGSRHPQLRGRAVSRAQAVPSLWRKAHTHGAAGDAASSRSALPPLHQEADVAARASCTRLVMICSTRCLYLYDPALLEDAELELPRATCGLRLA